MNNAVKNLGLATLIALTASCSNSKSLLGTSGFKEAAQIGVLQKGNKAHRQLEGYLDASEQKYSQRFDSKEDLKEFASSENYQLQKIDVFNSTIRDSLPDNDYRKFTLPWEDEKLKSETYVLKKTVEVNDSTRKDVIDGLYTKLGGEYVNLLGKKYNSIEDANKAFAEFGLKVQKKDENFAILTRISDTAVLAGYGLILYNAFKPSDAKSIGDGVRRGISGTGGASN